MPDTETPVPPVVPKPSPYPTSRHPLVIFLLLLCMMSGIPTLIGPASSPGSIDALLNPVMRTVWGAMLTAGPLVAIAGIIHRRLSASITLEQIGLVALGGAAVTYGAAIIEYNGRAGLQSGVLTIVFGAFALARVWQLVRWVNKQNELGNEIKRGA